MPIKKRLSKEEAVNARMPKGLRACLRHPLMQTLVYGGRFETTNVNIDRALQMTKSWKGASWADKVFVHLLDILLEKSGRAGVLDARQYERLQDHILRNEDEIRKADWQTWHLWIWDVYHDGAGLLEMEPGDLQLPTPPRTKPTLTASAAPPRKPKRRKLAKHA